MSWEHVGGNLSQTGGDEGVRIRRDDTCLGFNGLGRDYPGKKEKVSQIKGSAYNKVSGGPEAQNSTA